MGNHYIHQLEPVIFSLGPIQVRWYGLMYVVGFLIAGQLFKKLSQEKFFRVSEEKIDSLITTLIVCMFLGARIFYVFIYNWDYYQDHLLELLSVWQGGLSFHGALTGLIVGGFIFGKRNNLSIGEVMDNVALAGTPGLFFGRIGNFINGELYGRTTDSAIGMIFPGGGPYPRHPSQLYEAVLEGVVLTLILWALKLKFVKRYGELAAVFIAGYGIMRFIVEFYREPDTQLGYYFGFLTMGQILCFIMIVVGVIAYNLALRKNQRI